MDSLFYYSGWQYIEFLIRLVIAVFCGAIIGYERERKSKDAGIRTHVIVTVSAALMMIVSKYGFADLVSHGEYIVGTNGVDPARIAAQVISGVGFIGAGVIFHDKNNTKGITTASGIWAMAGIGISIGAGMYGVGLFATLLLLGIHLLEKSVVKKFPGMSVMKVVIVANNNRKLRQSIQEYIIYRGYSIKKESVAIDNDIITYELTVNTSSGPDVDSINSFFEGYDDIKSMSVTVIS